MRIVLDTNIFISALIYRGRPEALLQMISLDIYSLTTSEEILQELESVLLRKFGWPGHRADAALRSIRRVAELVRPQVIVTDCEDPDDNRILEAAVAGSADVIVTGDKHLLRMHLFRGIEILKVDAFLGRVEGLSHQE